MSTAKTGRLTVASRISRMLAPQSLIASIHASAAVLTSSGLLHLSLFACGNPSWEGPLSPRKPGLFGISAGLTIYSLAWCWNVLRKDRQFLRVCAGISWGLFLEVFLITVQYWRGVPSHFNRTTWFDAIIEAAMVALISGVAIGVFWSTWFSMKPFDIDREQLLVIRAGLTFLSIACVLGFGTMFAGEFNNAMGRPIEFWGKHGVLKYPHGAVLHALQILPFLNWALMRFKVPRREAFLRIAVAANCLFLTHAIWQTSTGHGRLEFTLLGWMTFSMAIFLFTIPLAAMIPSAFGFRRQLLRADTQSVSQKI